ncbi:ninein-like [Huso huso]|uniref:Ninein-like n=1 Tax=Huso huso TaxID=61971 RepID=A0ABR0ZAJ8_HUSHU
MLAGPVTTDPSEREGKPGEQGRAAVTARWVVLCYGMDGAQLDEYEVRLKEVFDGFDGSGSGSLCQEELSDLCQALHLEEAAPALLRELVQEGNPSDRVHFEQFKDALILVLSTTLGGHPSSEENSQEPDSSEANPKFVKDGKRYGRRSLPEFGESIEGFAEVSETESAPPEENPQNTPPRDGCEVSCGSGTPMTLARPAGGSPPPRTGWRSGWGLSVKSWGCLVTAVQAAGS